MAGEIKNAVEITDNEAQYDAGAKRILGNKYILAHILIKTVAEFKGMNPKEVVGLIEGEPMIGTVPVEPGMTNAAAGEKGQRIIGLNTENGEISEGLVRFDIVFYVRMKDGVAQIIVNVEAQRKEPEKYHILNRAVFYVSRLISSQKERDFVNSDYDDIKRVFSIWICMNMGESSMNYVRLTDESLLGHYRCEGNLNLINIVLIGLAGELPEHDGDYELHRLLGALLSDSLSVDEKLNIIGTEYEIPLENKLREDVNVMCNLSQGIKETGIAIGKETGIAIGKELGEEIGEARILLSMRKKGYTIEQIADMTDKSVGEIESLLAKTEPVLV